MPQPSSSASTSQPRHISAAEIRGFLRQLYKAPADASFLWHLSQSLSDPLKAGKGGRFRLSPVVLPLAAAALFMLSVFIYFNFMRS
jgi:hypothetical protein